MLALLADDAHVVDGSATASDVVIHLGAGDHDRRARRRENVTDGVAAMLDDATVGGATHIVLVSSALVYGAYANNPIPLTEDAILRPDVEFVYARQLATVEAMVDRWRRDDPRRAVCVLRPVVAMAADGTPSLAAALAAGFGQRLGADDPPAQFLHLDDLAVGGRAGRRPAPRRRVQRRARRLGGGRAGPGADRRHAAHPAARPAGRDRHRAALAVPARPDPAGPAQLHAGAVARRQRPPEGPGLDARR